MGVKIDFFKENFKPIGSILNYFENEELENDSSLAETIQAKSKHQIIPSLYLERTDNIIFNGGVKSNKVKFSDSSELVTDVIAFSGYGLKIFSFPKKIIFSFELYNDEISDYYNSKNSLFNFFLSVERKDIISFTKKNQIKFYGVNPKNSIEFKHNTRHGAKGIIVNAIASGITKLASNIEDDLKIKDGILYELAYLENNILNKINIVSELYYIDIFYANQGLN